MDNIQFTREQKISLYAALCAFMISLLAGMTVRNPIGVLFMRAFISMILFGAIIWGALYILRRYIPEFLASGNQLPENGIGHGGAGQQGKTVDYTLAEPIDLALAAGGVGIEGSGMHAADMGSGRVATQKLGKGPGPGAERLTAENPLWEGGEIPSLDHLFDEQEKEFVPDVEVDREDMGKPKQRGGDYIEVGKIRIPNEPEILAKAIKRMMKESSNE